MLWHSCYPNGGQAVLSATVSRAKPLGGTNDFENLIIVCAACNYGRMQFTFAEVGFHNPMSREPVHSNWDGLERVLPSSPLHALSSIPFIKRDVGLALKK